MNAMDYQVRRLKAVIKRWNVAKDEVKVKET
jgi:hypothetical protein